MIIFSGSIKAIYVADHAIAYPEHEYLGSDILGKWEYAYSLNKQDTFQAPFNKICPVSAMQFSHCIDSIDMIGFPKIVLNMRKNDPLENISCITYDTMGKKIDTYFPVVIFDNYTYTSGIPIAQYGYIHKSEYTIYSIANDTMIIGDGLVYYDKTNQQFTAKHVYTRSNQ